MAYMNQKRKAIINDLMKPVLKKYKVKATLKVSNSTIYLNIKSSPLDFFGQINKIAEQNHRDSSPYTPVTDSLQVNPYWFHKHFEGEILEFMQEAHAALRGADYYNNSDAQIDYHNVAYYYYVNIGQWDKPYELITG